MVVERKYYLNIDEQNIGPLSFNDILIRIKNGLLSGADLIFMVGTKEWIFIKDLPEFKSFINDIPLTEMKIWYVRKSQRNVGPFSHKDILRMLHSGYIDTDDYVWKRGDENWVQIKDVNDERFPME